MEKEGRNKQAPLLSQGLWSLNYSCPHLISALIMSFTLLVDGKSQVAAAPWEPTPNCSLLTKCLCKSLLGATGQPHPNHRMSAAVLTTLPGLSKCQLLKG